MNNNIVPGSSMGDKIESLQEEIFELNKLFELTKILNCSSSTSNIAEKLVSFIQFTMNTKNAAFFINENDTFRILAFKNFELPCTFEFSNNGEGIWKIIQEGFPFILVDENNKNIYSQFLESYKLEELKTNVFVPFINEGKIIAILSLGMKNNGMPYSKKDLNLLSRVSDYISAALKKFIEDERKQKTSVRLQKTLHNISILYNIGLAINFIDDLKKLLKVILGNAISTIGAEKGSLMLFDPSSQDLIVKVVHGLADKEFEDKINEGLIECTKIKIGEGIAGEVFVTKKPIIANLGSFDPKFKQSSNSNVSSILCIPLIFKSECIGVINITNKLHEKLFNQDDMEFMLALSNQASMAINNAQLYELAIKDGLTKLFIYRHFHFLLESELKRCERYRHPVSLLMMDIDNFKMINDAYGHPVGDEILKETAEVIVKTCRKIDMPCRYGGEEFSVILPETVIENAKIIAERLRQGIEEVRVTTKNDIVISPTISIGIASFPEHGGTSDKLIESADNALYHAKRSGKNCVAQYSKDGCEVISCSINWQKNTLNTKKEG